MTYNKKEREQYNEHRQRDGSEDDIRLIASAPELLEACKEALDYEANICERSDSNLAKLLMQAIAKAEGKQ
jgi:hypothetical protein